MNKFKILILIFTVFATISACSSDSNPSTPAPSGSLAALSCDGVRTWDTGPSDVLAETQSYIAESSNANLGSTKFPCTVFWEYNATFNCSLGFSYEDFLDTFGLPDVLQEVGTSGASLVLVGSDNSRQTAAPANISATDLANFPDCEL